MAGYPISIIRYKPSVKVLKVLYLSEVKITLKSKYIVWQELPTQSYIHKNGISTPVKHNMLTFSKLVVEYISDHNFTQIYF